MDPRIQLDNYEILELLGKGGMGEVYRARDAKLGRDVAIKLLPDALDGDADRLGRLRREAHSLAALNHPHIATIHDLGEQDGRTFIVMELIAGDTLADRLQRGALDVPVALDIAGQIARALDAAHAAGIVHRDLKPENIKITSDGHVKVLDFGLAKRQEAAIDQAATEVATEVNATQTGTVMGTPPYMSPEQIRAEPVDQRSDAWAFGCVLYEMLTGQRAFGRETPSDTLAAVLTAEPDEQRLPRDLPDTVRGLLHGTLTKDINRRLGSMRDAAVTLDDARRRIESGSYSGPTAAPAPRRNPLPGIAGAVLVVAAIAAGWYLLSGDDAAAPASVTPAADTNRSIAVLPFDTLGQAEPTVFTEGVHVDMLTRLSRLPDLRVTSRVSVMQYRALDRPLPEIAAELGVAWVLLGEVQEAGSQVQVNARLVNALEDRQVWADTYRRELTAENLFDIQGELAEQIATQLQAQLTPETRTAVTTRPTGSLEAYRLYVQGRALLVNRANDEMRRALEYFDQAVALDDGYAPAWAGIAGATALLESYGYAPDEDLVTRGVEAADRALAIDPFLAEAHAARGLLFAQLPDVPPATATGALRRAAEIQPSYAEAHNWLAWGYLLNGDAVLAAESAARAVELDPLSLEAVSNLALAYVSTGRFDDGLAESERLVTIGPLFDTGHFYLAVAAAHLGDHDTAREQAADLVIPWAGSGPLATEAIAAVGAGNTDDALNLLTTIEQTGHPFDAGLVHAALGNTDDAWAAFSSIDQWDQWPRIAAHFLFPEILAPFRDDPRWDQLVAPITAEFD